MAVPRADLAARAACAAGIAGVLLAGCNGGSSPRPSPEMGEVLRVVGGGDVYLPTLEGTVDTTDIDGADLAAMAVEPDGTLWLVHANGELFAAGTDGRLARALEAKVPPIADLSAVEIGPDGALYVVTDASDLVARLDTADPDAEWTYTEIVGLPDPSAPTGIAVGLDGTVYVADGFTGVVYRLDQDGHATPVDGTPAGDCRSGRRRLDPVDLTTAAAAIVVADPNCPAPYQPGAGAVADPPECPASPQGPVSPVATASRADDDSLIVGGRSCPLVWMVSEQDGEVTVLADGQDLSGDVRGVAIDSDGIVYVRDDDGVVAIRAR